MKNHRMPDVDYERGEEVTVTSTTRGWRVRGRGESSFKKGERLEVVRAAAGRRLTVRRPGGYVYSIDARVVAPVDRPLRFLGDAPAGDISLDDPKLDWFWRDAAKAADLSGHCREYERLCEILGIPGRSRLFEVSIPVAQGIDLRGKVTARSRPEAERMLLDQVRSRPMPALQLSAA